MQFKDQKILITGASVGIGRAIAEKLAQEGAHVGLVARSVDRLKEVQKGIAKQGGQATVFSGDLGSTAGIDALWSSIASNWSGMDALVNAAGVWHDDGNLLLGPTLQNTSVKHIERVFAVQLYAPILLSRKAIPGMVERGGGKILNISGELKSAVGWLHYYVSKKALEEFTIGLSEELRPHEIQVNCISPSDTLSETYAEYFPGYDPKDVLDPEEVAKFTAFLLSQDADHITGSVTIIRSKSARSTDDAHEKLISSTGPTDEVSVS